MESVKNTKAILIVDMPKNCAECLLHYDYLHCIVFENMSVEPEKFEEIRNGFSFTSEYCDYRPPLCPLKSIPEKYDYYLGGDYADGWNAFIDEILEAKHGID